MFIYSKILKVCSICCIFLGDSDDEPLQRKKAKLQVRAKIALSLEKPCQQAVKETNETDEQNDIIEAENQADMVAEIGVVQYDLPEIGMVS